MNQELQGVQTGFRKGRGARVQIAYIRWIIEKAREFQKNIDFCFINYTKAFEFVEHEKLWQILKEIGILDHYTYLLRNLYTSQEAIVKTGHRTMNWFKTGKAVCEGFVLSPCLFNFSVEYIMQNARLDDLQAGINIAGRNNNSLRFRVVLSAYLRLLIFLPATLMAESEEELKSLLMKMKEERENAGLKLSIQNTKIMASGPITSWQVEGGKVEAMTDFIFLGLKNHCGRWLHQLN